MTDSSGRLLARLRKAECPQVTYSDRDFPVFIRRARGAQVWDADGNEYLDLTAFFGVCGLGHANPVVARAAAKAFRNGCHAMGDVHPHENKIQAAEAVVSVLPKPLTQVFFSCNGSDAVETALKTAFLHTRRPGVIAFEGAYHGLGYGAMQVTHRAYFREPFIRQAKPFARFAPFVGEGAPAKDRDRALEIFETLVRNKSLNPGAVIIEPIQGRAGVRPADPLFLRQMVRMARRAGMVVIFDEIFTGFCRTGDWFAFERYGEVPDLLCVGKGMSNGFPISACVGDPRVFKSWGPSRGEAKHTSTFLGHPVGCAMVAATVSEMKRIDAPELVRQKGERLLEWIRGLALARPGEITAVRGRGLMLGIVLSRPAAMMRRLLKRGVIALSSGEKSEVLSLTPPFTITVPQIRKAVSRIEACLD